MSPAATMGQDTVKEKETQDTRRVRDETSVPRPSQDAELKDYVGGIHVGLGKLGRLTPESSNWEIVSERELTDLFSGR